MSTRIQHLIAAITGIEQMANTRKKQQTTHEHRNHVLRLTNDGWIIDHEEEEIAGPFGLFDDAIAHVDHILDRDEEQDEQIEAADGDNEQDDRPNSVVASSFKAKYRERAAAMARKPKDVPMKALKRSTSDWLAVELARRTLDDKAKLVVPEFEAILNANGVKHGHWNRTTRGWQGRLRMTGRLALQRVVAEHGELSLPNGEAIPAPKSWIAKHTH